MQTNIRRITGNWADGYVLDKHTVHSHVIGENEYGHPIFDTLRTEAGEALYQLKYKQDFAQAELLAAQIVCSILPHFHAELIVPMPASNTRNVQPVDLIANAIGRMTDIPVFDKLMTKSKNGKQLKNLKTKEEKIAALQGTFTVCDGIAGTSSYSALLVDDLFNTGASVEAACAALMQYPRIKRVYVAAATWS